jgi:hypothetical protein
MNLEDLKARTIQILTHVDPVYFQPTIEYIKKIKAKTESGFDDIHAKVLIISAVMNRLENENYFSLLPDKRKKLLLQTTFEDGCVSEKDKKALLNNTIKDADVMEVGEEGLLQFHKDKLKIDAFLAAADNLRSIYITRAKHTPLTKISHENLLKTNVTIDIEQDEDEINTVLKKDDVIGTSGLGSCLFVCFIGKNNENKTVVSAGHYSTLENDTIESIKADLITEFAIKKETLRIYLIGGCIESISFCLDLLMQTQLDITDFRLCLNDGELLDDPNSVLISGKNPDKIFYSMAEKLMPTNAIDNPASTSSDKKSGLKRSGATFFEAEPIVSQEESGKKLRLSPNNK